jgi:Glu-tRNA(Gln) amidotransferase subunit E-like FAD-binding protein
MKKQELIGLEIHGYLETKEKLFCNCKNYHDMKLNFLTKKQLTNSFK